jgi:hypothetical protein
MSTHQITKMLYDYNMPEVTIVFDDASEVKSKAKKVIVSSYFWDIFRHYSQTKITSKHHIDSILKGNPLTSNTHIDMLAVINRDVELAYNLHLPIEKEHLLAMIHDVSNNIFNEVTKLSETHVTSIDILDFIEVIEHPVIKKTNDETTADPNSISNNYKTILGVIANDPSLANNALVKAVKNKMVNANQVCQCVAVRGFPTEVDGTILKVPILTNYTRGMNTLYEFIADSRSAAKALYFAEAPLQDAEYFARRLQLLSMVVERIDYADCGTTERVQWRVAPPSYDDKGNMVYPGDLAFMIGKFYNDSVTGEEKEINGKEDHLWNTVIKMRSVLYCKTGDPHSVCEKCFGGLSRNVSRFANLGHLCSATMTQQTSQSVLSTKHLDASSVSASIVLNEVSGKFLSTNRAKNAYLVRKELKDKNVKMVVSRDEVIGLTDILSIDDVQNINPIRISAIECIEISHSVKNEVIPFSMPIFVNQGNRKALLTTEFLSYLKTHRWETDSKNNFVFDLKDWNFSLPVMKLREMEYSYSDHSHQIAKVIESSMKNITDRSNPHSPVSTLQELFSLVNTKLNVNIAALEVIIYASMVPSKDSYDMARNHQSPTLGVADMIIKNRSLAPAYAYEDQWQTLTSPRSFFMLDRPDSVFDVQLLPNEVVQHYKSLGKE